MDVTKTFLGVGGRQCINVDYYILGGRLLSVSKEVNYSENLEK